MHALFTAEGRADPHPIYRRLRAEDPVCRIVEPRGFPIWVFARYGDCVDLLRDSRLTKDFRKLPPEVAARYRSIVAPMEQVRRHMLTSDPPDHGRLRTIVSKAFTPERVERLRPRVEAITESLLTDVAGRGAMELVAEFAFPLPMTVISELLGVPASDRKQFRAWTTALLSTPSSGAEIGRQAAAGEAFAGYLRGLIALRRAHPVDDLVSDLVQAEESGDRLSSEELLGTLFLLLVAGHETTVNLIANGAKALIDHPNQRRLLVDHPALIGSAVEEVLRFCGSVKHTTDRWSLEEIEYGGRRIPAGEFCTALLLSANRDEERFPDPDRFDVARSPNKHLAFGSGIHFCLGAPLARLEAQVAILALFQRLRELRLAVRPGETRYSTAFLFYAPERLPVVFTPESAQADVA